jgi:hypothetical protein
MAFVLFSTDAWHTHSSKEVMGVFTEKKRLIKELGKLSDVTEEHLEELAANNQTQGHDVNYMIEEFPTNSIEN